MKWLIKEEIVNLYTEPWVKIVEPYKSVDIERLRSAHLEPYKLLIFLAHQYYGGLFYDIGTRRGTSALALGSRKNNKVISWDIQDNSRKVAQYAYPDIKGYPNIEFRLKDIFEEPDSIYDKADIISLDIDPHDGIQEDRLLRILDKTVFKGLLIMDDIRHEKKPKLRALWDSIKRPKYEIPKSYSHGSGTGIVSYGEELIVDSA